MKYLTLMVLFLASCTTPELIHTYDKNGNIIHSAHKEPFFNSPDKTSEWLFWYTPIFLLAAWFIWREAKAIYYDCKKIKENEEESN